MQNCIRVVNLSKTYHNEAVVKSISFEVEQGQIFAFLGPNGAGKSTTMNILSTLLAKSDGIVQIDGLNIDRQQNEIKKRIGIVFQSDVLDDDLTVYKNLLFRGNLYGNNLRQTKKRINSIATKLSLTPILNKKYKECSGGQKRIIQIARALLPNPKLLILDEPTTGLDPLARRTVWQLLLTLRDQLNITIFYTTHYMEEALYADKYCILNKGKILICNSLKELKERQTQSSYSLNESLNSVYFNLLSQGEAQ